MTKPQSVYYLLLFLGLISIATLKVTVSLSEKVLFESLLLLISLQILFTYHVRLKASLMIIGCVIALYLAYTLHVAFAVKNSHPLDYAQAFKAYYYPLVLLLLVRPNQLKFNTRITLNLFIAVFLIKYLLVTYVLGGRPFVFVENNFELVFLLMLLIAFLIRGNRLTVWHYAALIAIFLLSTSRSALVCLLAVLVLKESKFFLKPKVMLTGLVVACASVFVFISRMNPQLGIAAIDRVKFMLVFWDEMKNPVHWLIGKPPMTPLSAESCLSLKPWDALYSHAGDGTCYSVILHSYVLRAIHDQGIIFFGILIAFYFLAFKKSNISTKFSAMILIVLILTGLSVSSFNSIFAIIGIAYILLVANSHHARTK